MKKFACILLVLLLFSLCGCEERPAGSAVQTVLVESLPEEHIVLDTNVLYIRADSSRSDGFSALFPMENANQMGISSMHHLPVLHFENAEEFSARVEELKEYFQLDVSYYGAASFMEQATAFDKAFFEENDLLVVYTTASSGSFRYEVTSADVLRGSLMIWVEEIRPEIGTDDIAEWFILLPVPRAQLENCRDMDAVLTGGDW